MYPDDYYVFWGVYVDPYPYEGREIFDGIEELKKVIEFKEPKFKFLHSVEPYDDLVDKTTESIIKALRN